MRFSERIGKRAPKDIIQVDSMDDDLRNGLWNAVHNYLIHNFEGRYMQSASQNDLYKVIYFVWVDFLKQPADEILGSSSSIAQFLREIL